MTPADAAPRRRLDERVQPGWASTGEALLRYGGLAVAGLLVWLGFLTGGFFLLLTGVLAAIAAIGGWLLANVVRTERWYGRPNAKMLTALLVIGFPLLLIAFSQLAGPLLTPPPTRELTREGTLVADVETVETIAVDPRIETMQLSLDISGMGGRAVRWFISDPTGQSRWSGRTDAPGFQESPALPASGGQWQLHLTSEGGPARYTAQWQGWLASEEAPASR